MLRLYLSNSTDIAIVKVVAHHRRVVILWTTSNHDKFIGLQFCSVRKSSSPFVTTAVRMKPFPVWHRGQSSEASSFRLTALLNWGRSFKRITWPKSMDSYLSVRPPIQPGFLIEANTIVRSSICSCWWWIFTPWYEQKEHSVSFKIIYGDASEIILPQNFEIASSVSLLFWFHRKRLHFGSSFSADVYRTRAFIAHFNSGMMKLLWILNELLTISSHFS